MKRLSACPNLAGGITVSTANKVLMQRPNMVVKDERILAAVDMATRSILPRMNSKLRRLQPKTSSSFDSAWLRDDESRDSYLILNAIRAGN